MLRETGKSSRRRLPHLLHPDSTKNSPMVGLSHYTTFETSPKHNSSILHRANPCIRFVDAFPGVAESAMLLNQQPLRTQRTGPYDISYCRLPMAVQKAANILAWKS